MSDSDSIMKRLKLESAANKSLEPMGKKDSSLGVLLLRDGKSVFRFRLNPLWIKFSVVFLILFSAASGASAYGVHYYWKKYQALQAERANLRELVAEKNRRINRLSYASTHNGKDSDMEDGDMHVALAEPANGSRGGVPRSSMTPVGGVLHQPHGGGESNGASQSAQVPQESAAGANGAPNGAAPPQGAAESAPAPVVPASNGEAGAAQAAEEKKDEFPIQIKEIQVAANGEGYQLSFELENIERKNSISGRVQLMVSAKSGARHEVRRTRGDSLRFGIKFFKKVNMAFSLPEEMASQDVDRLYLTAVTSNSSGGVYSVPLPPLSPVAQP